MRHGISYMSAVWNYFKVDEDDKTRADCKLCSVKLSRGGAKGSALNTSNLIKHLKSKHDNEYKEFTDSVKKHIHSRLQASSEFSFTTDIWTSSVSPVSLISLTSQWIDESFTSQRAILHAKQLRGSHTSQAIAHVFEEMLGYT
uniref:Zinc finger, BED domain containing 4 n=1 Tax=Nothobranchius kuhntae TaxID=321403 RepID=A0A1A8J877_NOTKU